MPVARDPTPAVPAPTTGVSFEVERFEWSDGRLVVAGRWFGIRGRRFLRPTLDVEMEAGARRMLAVLEHKPWAADDGEEWIAAFEWTGEPVELAAAELAVGPELAVELPPPSGTPATKTRARQAGRRREARPPRAQALEAELAGARAEVEDLRTRLAAEQREGAKRNEDLEALRAETASARESAAAAREEALAARDEAVAERDGAMAERDAALAEREAAAVARDAALAQAAKAAAERERAVRERAAVEQELAAAVQARDRARHERNAWLTRARAAADEQGPAAASEGPAPDRGAREAAPAEREAAPPAREPAPAAREAAPPAREPAPADRDPLPGTGRLGRRLRRRPARAPLPPGGILLPPTGPGSHTRRSILPGWAPRVLAPLALVVLLVVVALLIAWAF
jgi:hypothetical protein